MKRTKCHECWGLNGHHWNGCKTRGYAAVGPHPNAPAPEEQSTVDPTALLEMCCGGTCVRAVCPYHGPSTAGSGDSAEFQLSAQTLTDYDLAAECPDIKSGDIVTIVLTGNVIVYGGVIGVPTAGDADDHQPHP